MNGEHREAEVEPRLLLVHLLRETLGLTGTHVGCDTSNCGACTVHLDGEAVKSCTVLAVQADGGSVTTIEGLGQTGALHPLQEAFWEHHGTSIDDSAARERPGVHAVFTGEDVDLAAPLPMAWVPPGVDVNTPVHCPLAKEEVKHVGDPVAVVFGDDRMAVVDAAEDVVVEYEPLDADRIAAAAGQAAEGTSPPADLNATADYKRHLARVLRRRALQEAVA